jgi:hypothetical protein
MLALRYIEWYIPASQPLVVSMLILLIEGVKSYQDVIVNGIMQSFIKIDQLLGMILMSLFDLGWADMCITLIWFCSNGFTSSAQQQTSPQGSG